MYGSIRWVNFIGPHTSNFRLTKKTHIAKQSLVLNFQLHNVNESNMEFNQDWISIVQLQCILSNLDVGEVEATLKKRG